VVAADVSGIEQPVGVEGGLEVAEGVPEVVAVQLPVPLGPGAAVPVFARHRPAEPDHGVGDAVGDVDHRVHVVHVFRVDQGRMWSTPGPACA